MEKERQGQTIKAHELLALLQRLLKLGAEQLGDEGVTDDAHRLVAVAWLEALAVPNTSSVPLSDDAEAELVQRLVRGAAEGLDAYVLATTSSLPSPSAEPSPSPSPPSSPAASALVVARVLARVLVVGLDVLTHMVEPLLTYQAYDAFLLAMAIVLDGERVAVLRALLGALPSRYRALVAELLGLLHRVAHHAASPPALALALATLAPSFIRPYKLVYYMEADGALQRALVTTLVAHAPHVLQPAHTPPPPEQQQEAIKRGSEMRPRPEWLRD